MSSSCGVEDVFARFDLRPVNPTPSKRLPLVLALVVGIVLTQVARNCGDTCACNGVSKNESSKVSMFAKVEVAVE